MSDFRAHLEPNADPPTATVIVREGIVSEETLAAWEERWIEDAGPRTAHVVRRIMAAARRGLKRQRTDMVAIRAEAARLLRQMADQVEKRVE